MADALPNPEQCCTTCDDQVSVLIPGPAGSSGAAGAAGTNGTSAVTTVNQVGGFVMPTTDATVVVTVVASAGFAVGQYVFVQNAGYLKVSAKTSATSLTLLNENYPGNAPAASVIADGSQIVPGGIKGLDGGVDFSTTTTASFVMPDVNTTYETTFRARASNVATLTTSAAHNLSTGDYVQVASVGGAGYNDNIAQVTVTGATTFTYANTGGDEASTADTAGRVTPNIQIAVTTSLGFVAGQDVFIQDAGYFYVQEVPDTTHLIIQNNGTANNETSGTTIASGVRVSVYVTMNSLSPTTTKGDILVDEGDNSPLADLNRMGVGTDGQALVSDSAEALGRKNVTILPNSGTDNAILRLDGTTGKPIPAQASLMLISDTGALQSTPSGGNARGASAIDLQVVRSGATQVASGANATISGGQNNIASAANATASGGTTNTASGTASTVSGGTTNSATTTNATVGGGNTNAASGIESVVGGGFSNTASGTYSSISGGASNTASSDACSVGGGSSNAASEVYATIAGGASNIASGQYSVVGGGSSNTASGTLATVSGGATNTASGSYSSASGRYAAASLYGEKSEAAGRFATDGDAQVRNFICRRSTSNATPTELFLDGSSLYLTIPNDTTWTFDILISARRTDVDDESAAYRLVGCIDRNGSAATTALVGSVTKTVIAEDTAAWDVAATADTTNGYLAITVTGEAAKTIRWVASVKVVQVTG